MRRSPSGWTTGPSSSHRTWPNGPNGTALTGLVDRFDQTESARRQATPVPALGLADGQVLSIPAVFEFTEHQLGLLCGGGRVDAAQVRRHFFAALPRDVIQAVAHHVHHAQLHHCLWENGLDGVREALEPVDAGDEDVLYTSVAQFGHDLQPELGALGLGQPQAQHPTSSTAPSNSSASVAKPTTSAVCAFRLAY